MPRGIRSVVRAGTSPAPSRRSSGLAADAGCGNRAHAASSVVIEGLRQLLVGVHHEWPVPGNRLTDRLTAQHQHLEVRRAAFLREVGGQADHVARAKRRQLSRSDDRPLLAYRSAAGQYVREAVEIPAPRYALLSPRILAY